MQIKIFRSANDFAAAATAEEATKIFNEEYGFEPEDEEYAKPEDCYEISDNELDKFRYCDEDEGYQCSFREQLQRLVEQGQKFPCLFAIYEP